VGTGFQFRFHVTNLLQSGLPERYFVGYLQPWNRLGVTRLGLLQ
jgi:hypothetical protein